MWIRAGDNRRINLAQVGAVEFGDAAVVFKCAGGDYTVLDLSASEIEKLRAEIDSKTQDPRLKVDFAGD